MPTEILVCGGAGYIGAQRAKNILRWTPRSSELTMILSDAWAWHRAQASVAAAAP